jgi:hypothetical protein
MKMPTFPISGINFSISPVSILQCWIGIGWNARGTEKDIKEFRVFSEYFFPFLLSQDTETKIQDFCTASNNKIDEILRDQELRTEFISRFAARLKGRLNNSNQHRSIQFAQEYAESLRSWLFSPMCNLGQTAAQLLWDWGLPPPYKGLGAVGSFGNAVFGKYVPDLKAVCVQLDVIAQSNSPKIQFLETLFHEEIHAAIHCMMGDDDDRPELTWLNELCAVLTSQYALKVAAKQILDKGAFDDLVKSLDIIRAKQKYGELAQTVEQETGDPLIALKAWKRIFELTDSEKLKYASDSVITPILHDLGWLVKFPYEYKDKYVTVFV